MKINNPFNISSNFENKKSKIKKVETAVVEKIKKAPAKAKLGAIVALFLLPTLGSIKTCSEPSDEGIEVSIYSDLSFRDDYVDKTEKCFYEVQKGDNPNKIADMFNISTERLLKENGLEAGAIIHPGDTLLIPETYTVKNVNTIEDVAGVSGIDTPCLEQIINFEGKKNELYQDRNGNWTIGIGHLVKENELSKYKGRTLSDSEIYTLFAEDLLKTDLNLATLLGENVCKDMRFQLKESVMDLAFNKGLGAIRDNEELFQALKDGDIEKAITNLTQDYSVITKEDGTKVNKPASGLSKRRLYDISHAAEIYKGKTPKSIINVAKEVYERGLVYMEQEKERGEIPAEAYPNVVAEYKDLAYKWFNGEIGEKRVENTSAQPVEEKQISTEQTSTAATTSTTEANNPKANKTIYVNGKKTTWTVSTLYNDWQKNAKNKLRPVIRPMPEIDAKGNIVASVKILEPTKKGELTGKIFIINPGHGGCVNNIDKKGKINVNFDPGTSNAVMSKKNANLETNTFIGNKGKALEEWVINQDFADSLTEKIRQQGGKVIYVQGSVYSAQKAIRELVKKYHVDMLISLHSNSAGTTRGIQVISCNRGGTDVKDQQLAKKVETRLNNNATFSGLVTQPERSLGVLSADSKHSLPVPAIMLETGNLKNKDDIANLTSNKFKAQFIDCLFAGMKDYLK